MATNPPAATAPRPGFLFFICPDAQILRERVDEEAAAFAGEGELERCCHWGDEPPSSAFWNGLAVSGFFSSRRILVVRQANRWPASVWQAVDKALSRPRKGILPVFCLEGEWTKARWNTPAEPKIPAVISRLRCWEFAGRRGWVWKDEGLNDGNIRARILRVSQDRGLRLSHQAIARLAESLPRSAEVVANEIEKLSLLPGARERLLGVEDLSTADWIPDANIFDCLDALFACNEQRLWNQARLIQDRDAAFFVMLTMVANNLRLLWNDQAGQIVAFRGRNRNLMPKLGERMGLAGIRDAMCAVVDAERAVKTGQATTDQALDSFLSRLLAIFRTPASAGR